MFGSAILDLLIGIIVIYLVVALAVTAMTEMVSQWLSIRSAELKKAIVGMLSQNKAPDYSKPTGVGAYLSCMLSFIGKLFGDNKIDPGHWFLDQPLIKSLCKGTGSLPSYIDRDHFSAAVLVAIDPNYANMTATQMSIKIAELRLPGDIPELLQSFLAQANGDIDKFRASIESWFDSVMDRVSGWYKKRMANWTLILSAFIVIGGNIDTIMITQSLYGDPALRESMVAIASGYAKQASPENKDRPKVDPEQFSKDMAKFRAAGLPLGWQKEDLKELKKIGDTPDWGWLVSKLAGLLLTIGAASLGAPFWFDMLSKIMSVRNSGPKTERNQTNK